MSDIKNFFHNRSNEKLVVVLKDEFLPQILDIKSWKNPGKICETFICFEQKDASITSCIFVTVFDNGGLTAFRETPTGNKTYMREWCSINTFKLNQMHKTTSEQ